MLLHYFKVGLRNILKYKVFSFINVFGLAAAMSVSMLILLMLADQKSHDQFNVNKDRILRILCDRPDFRNPNATTAVPLAAAVKAELPAVETTTHLVMGVGGDIGVGLAEPSGAKVPNEVGRGTTPGRSSAEARGYFADTAFFRVFSFELGRGNPATALAAPRSLVITHELAVRLFGDSDPIGRAVEWTDRGLSVFGNGSASTPVPWGSFKITGVIADRHYRSHLQFDVLMSESSEAMLVQDKKMPDYKQNWEWYSNSFTYVLMRPGKNEGDLDAGLREVAANHYRGLADFKGVKLFGQPLTRISPGILLGNDPVVALPMVAYYLLSFLAALILVLAGLNYVNLSVARALSRAREIGVRKVSGAHRANLVLQFLGESVITALSSLGMAGVFLLVLKAAFVRLWVNQYLNFELSGGVGVYLIFVGFAVVVGVLAGLYPALRLSGIGVIPALKSNDGLRMGRLGMRKALSVVQFVFSLLFIVTSILIYNQFRYFIDFNYEFNTRNVVNIDLQNNDFRVAEKAMAAIPGIAEVSASEYMPAETRSEGGSLRRPDGKPHPDKSDFKPVMTMGADEHFLDNLGLKLMAGRGLLPEGPGVGRQIVVNEALVKAFGYSSPAAIVGQQLESEWNDSGVVVIGVVQDFHMRMILGNDRIDPLYLHSNAKNYQYVNLRLGTGDIRGTVARLGVVWRQIDPVHALKYSFYSDELANQSQGIFDVVSILGFIAALAVTIACLGMLGMAMYTTERRRKEVGIRKVLGAGDLRNVLLLSREFLVVLGVAIAIAAPLSYILNEMWLRMFPNRVEFGWGTVGLGVLILLVLGLVTIGSQTLRASRRNPVESLRTEG
jgi:putative ABC transport system permease protein